MKMRPMLMAGAALVAVTLPLSAQQSVDARWLPFVGCWEALGAEEEIGLLCFDTDASGVVLTNYSDGEVVSSERLVADGQQRDVVVEGCEGWETVEFSADGRRAFTQTEFVCGGEDARTGSGVMTFTTANQWADVRALVVAGEEVAWVQEYRLASQERITEEGVTDPAADRAMAVRTARMAAAAPIDLDDVEEAAGRMDAKAVETWIVAKQDRFDPSAADLERLADAGASDAVIDAVVAVSYPERFIVDASGPVEQMADAPRPTHYRGYMAYAPFGPRLGFGVGYAPWGFGYSSYYGYGYGYGYAGSPWGYPGYGYGYGYGGYRPGYVVIDRRPSGGRVYSDRGYTQGGRTNSGTAGRVARPRGGDSSPTYSLGGGTRDRGTATSGGSSSTGRAATPRRARRRPPGGN